ncbi:MAG: hypothetical protein OXR64_02990 [Chloroflexota bacterium]|nr:hypothetical protein [Chloroflexota bacterium]
MSDCKSDFASRYGNGGPNHEPYDQHRSDTSPTGPQAGKAGAQSQHERQKRKVASVPVKAPKIVRSSFVPQDKGRSQKYGKACGKK